MILNSTKGATPPVDIGDLASTYSVVREIGRGGMGAVVVARHRGAGHFVAIKIASPDKVDLELLARFTREARLMARLQHPNIVKLYDVRPIGGGRLGIVMEYVRGESLADALNSRKRIPITACTDILRDVGRALSHAHAGGVIHRDVKPANVLLEAETGRARLSDFGIATGAGDSSEVTGGGGVVGTPAYMSPEQIDGLELDGRSDTYALGVLGWQLVSGQQPWEGEPLFRLLFKQKHEQLPSLRVIRPDTPAHLILAIEGALEKNPAHRWARVEDMLAQLESDEPTQANRERHSFAPSCIPPDRSLLEQATIPIYRRKHLPRLDEDNRNGETRELSRADHAPPVADAVVAAHEPRPQIRRWMPRPQFVAGAAVGAIIALLMLRPFTPRESAPASVRPDSSRAVPGSVAPPAVDAPAVRVVSSVSPSPDAPVTGAARNPATRVRRSDARAQRQLPPQPASATAPTIAAPNATPRTPDALTSLSERARALMFAGNSRRAAQMVDSALVLDARNGDAYSLRARIRISRGDVRDAWTDIELAARTGNQWEALALGTMLNAQESGARVARERIEKPLRAALAPRRKLDPERAVGLAMALVATGDTSTALTVLELSEKDSRLPMLLADPLLSQLRSSSRFDRVLRRAP